MNTGLERPIEVTGPPLVRETPTAYTLQIAQGVLDHLKSLLNSSRSKSKQIDQSALPPSQITNAPEVTSRPISPEARKLAEQIETLSPQEKAFVSYRYSESYTDGHQMFVSPIRQKEIERLISSSFQGREVPDEPVEQLFKQFLDVLPETLPRHYQAVLEEHITGPVFFSALLASDNPAAISFRCHEFWDNGARFEEWGEKTQLSFVLFLREHYGRLENIDPSRKFAMLLGITEDLEGKDLRDRIQLRAVEIGVFKSESHETTLEQLRWKERCNPERVGVLEATKNYCDIFNSSSAKGMEWEVRAQLAPYIFQDNPEAAEARAYFVDDLGSLTELLETNQGKEAFFGYAKKRFPTIWSVRADKQFARELGLTVEVGIDDPSGSASKHEVTDWRGVRIAQELYRLGVYGYELEDLRSLDLSQLKFTLSPEVVGARASEQLRDPLWKDREKELCRDEIDIYELSSLYERSQTIGTPIPYSVWNQVLRSAEKVRELIESSAPEIRALRSQIFRYDGGLQFDLLEDNVVNHFAEYFHSRFPALNDVKSSVELAEILGAKQYSLTKHGNGAIYIAPNRADWPIAQRLVELGFVDSEWDEEIPIARAPGSLSYHFMPEVVGDGQAQINKDRAIRAIFTTLDDVYSQGENKTAVKSVRLLMGLEPEGTVQELAKALFEQGYIHPIIPVGHELPYHRMSHYFDPEVVGIFAFYNLGCYIRELSTNADDYSGTVFANPYTDTDAGREFAKKMMEIGLLRKVAPEGQAPGQSNVRRKSTYFYDLDMVGPEALKINIDNFLRSLPSLDAIQQRTKGMRVLAILMNKTFSEIACYAVENGLQSPYPPEGHIPTSAKSHYFSVDVVGLEVATELCSVYGRKPPE